MLPLGNKIFHKPVQIDVFREFSPVQRIPLFLKLGKRDLAHLAAAVPVRIGRAYLLVREAFVECVGFKFIIAHGIAVAHPPVDFHAQSHKRGPIGRVFLDFPPKAFPR